MDWIKSSRVCVCVCVRVRACVRACVRARAPLHACVRLYIYKIVSIVSTLKGLSR